MNGVSDSEALRAELRRRLGLTAPQPAREAKVISEAPFPGGLRREIDLDGIPATLLLPPGPGPHPAVLYAHAHGGDYARGRRELTEGSVYLSAPWAGDLLSAGFAVLCLDMPGFGDRQGEGSEAALAKAALWRGDTLYGAMLRDQAAGLSWLAAQEFVDPARIAALGLSMGAAHAFWLGALDQRIGAVVHLCMLADIGALIASGVHDRHGIYLTVPGLLELCEVGDVAGLVAPRPQFVAHGATDELAPAPAREAALERLGAAYAARGGVLERFLAPDTGHLETPDMRRAALDFLCRWAAGSL